MAGKQAGSAIIIKSSDFKENDLLVTVYSQNFGKLNLLARGAKKFNSKLAAHVEPLSLVEVLIIPGKGIEYLAAASLKEQFLAIKNSWPKIEVAGLAFNLFNSAVKENDRDQTMFTWLVTWLRNLEKTKAENSQVLFALFLIRFLDLLGYRPDLSDCLACRQKLRAGQQFFNLNSGGLICQPCRSQFALKDILSLSENCVKLLRFLQKNQKSVVVKKSLIKELNDFLLKFWSYQKN